MHDLIIIGQEISAAVAALGAARRGLKTLLVRESADAACLGQGGYTFPADASPVTALGEGQPLARLLGEWGLSLSEAPLLVPMDPAFQVILPDQRVDVFSDSERFLAELLREWPGEGEEIRRWCRSVEAWSPRGEPLLWGQGPPPARQLGQGLRRGWQMAAVLAGFLALCRRRKRASRIRQRLLEAQLAMCSHGDRGAGLWPLVAPYLLALPQRGLFHVSGGREALAGWILAGFAQAGGEVMGEASVIRVELKPSPGVVLERGGDTLGFEGKRLIVGALWEKLPLFFGEQAGKRFLTRHQRATGGGFPFCLHLGVRQEALPESLAPYSVVVNDPSQPVRGSNAVFLETSLPGEEGRAPEGGRAVQATVFLDESPLRLTDKDLKEKAAAMMDALDGLLPFLRENIDSLNVDQSIAFSRRCQETARRRYPPGRLPWPGLKTFSPKTPFPGCYLTGGLLRSDLGFEGEVLAGIDALEMALKGA